MVIMSGLGAYFCKNEQDGIQLQSYMEVVPSDGVGHINMFKGLLNTGTGGVPIVNLRSSVNRVKIGDEVVSQLASVFAKLAVLYHNYLNTDDPMDLTVEQMDEVIKYWFTFNSQVLRHTLLTPKQRAHAVEELSKFDNYFRDDVVSTFMQALERNMDIPDASGHFRMYRCPDWLEG